MLNEAFDLVGLYFISKLMAALERSDIIENWIILGLKDLSKSTAAFKDPSEPKWRIFESFLGY